jgi:hypothetical protein
MNGVLYPFFSKNSVPILQKGHFGSPRVPSLHLFFAKNQSIFAISKSVFVIPESNFAISKSRTTPISESEQCHFQVKSGFQVKPK